MENCKEELLGLPGVQSVAHRPLCPLPGDAMRAVLHSGVELEQHGSKHWDGGGGLCHP